MLLALISCGGTENNDPWGKIDPTNTKKQSQVLELSLKSSVMKQVMTYSVWLPAEYDDNQVYPFLYLLHGYEYGDQSRLDRCWLDKGNASYIADSYVNDGGVPMVIVMPNGLSSFYQGDYETYFHEELMPAVEDAYHCNGRRAISGLSMGGHGTLYHALKYPEKFTCAYAMSPYSDIVKDLAQGWINAQSDKSVFPSFVIEVGTDDYTVNNKNSETLFNTLVKNGIACEYIERSGTHDWPFWKQCLPKALAAVGKSF